jgi:DNA-directed RNA polymerase specialized sigma subunit
MSLLDDFYTNQNAGDREATEAVESYIQSRTEEGDTENIQQDALEVYNTVKTAAYKKIDDHEALANWKKDKYSPESPHIQTLLTAHKKLINNYVTQYSRNPNVSKDAVHGEVMRLYIESLKRYNPNKGAQLTTHLNYWLPKVRRFVDSQANIGKIPETRTYMITDYNRARESLYELHNRHPTMEEVHAEMNERRKEEGRATVKIIDLKKLEKELEKKDLAESGFMEEHTQYTTPVEISAIQMLHSSSKLNDIEKQVFGKLYPLTEEGSLDFKAGKKPTAISRELGISAARMSRIVSGLKTKIRDTVNVLS